jgi:hypothetical protein
MFGLLSLLPAVFTTINGVTNAISNERLKLIDAKTEQERIATQERITSLQAKRDVMVAESQGSKLNASMRFILALGPCIFLTKIFLYDKVLGWGSTDSLDPNLWNVVMATIGFYFLAETAVNVTRIAKA